MKSHNHISPKGVRRAISIGVTMVLTGAAAIIVYGILELAVFNTKILVAVESRTENAKAATALMEFASAQLAAYLGSVPESTNFATEAKNFRFLDASHIFVGGPTAIGRGLIDLNDTIVAADGTTKPGTFCEVCAWPKAPLPTDAVAPSPVVLTTGPAELKNTPMSVQNTPLNSLDSALGASYSTSAYIPLRCRIAGVRDNKGVRRNVYATAVLWMRQANLFRHTLYLNDILYYMGTGGEMSWQGSIFSNKPLVFNLQLGGANPNAQDQTGTFQFEKVSSPQFFICPPGQYLNYANSGGWNSTTNSFNVPTADPSTSITQKAQPAWMGRGNLDWIEGWNTFKKGNALNAALDSWTKQNTGGSKLWNPLNVDSRPLYVTRQDAAGQLSPTDLSAFWQPYGTTPTVLDSRNPYQLQKYAPAFNGSYTTQENGFQPQLPDGIAAPSLARALIEPPSLLSADGTPVAPAKPELPKPTSRDKNPGLWDQWEAYASASARDLQSAESAKYAKKAGLYVHVDPEGTVMVFAGAADALAYKSAPDRTEWRKSNPTKVLQFADAGVIDTTNLFYDDTRIDRGTNGTGLNGSPASLLNNSGNSQNTSNGNITAAIDQSRVVRAVDINIGALRTALRGEGKIVDGSGAAWKPGAKDWQPVMYVDVESPTAATTDSSTWGKTINHLTSNVGYDVTGSDGTPVVDPVTKEKVVNKGVGFNGQSLTTNLNSRQHQTAVRFYNAMEIPDISQPGADMSVAKSDIPGFTLATNAAAYSVGSVNADADAATYPSQSDVSKQENNAVADGARFHAPFGVVCDTYTFMSPAYQGNLNAAKTVSNDRQANNLTSVTNFADARGLAFGDLATLLSIGYSGVDGSGATGPKNPYTGARLFDTADSVELTMALIAGAHDAQTQTAIHSEPLKSYLMDNNNRKTKYYFNGSVVGLFKSQYRPRWNPDAGGGSGYTGGGSATRYDPNFARGFVPPASPTMRSFRLYGFKLISEAEFNALALPSVSAVAPTAP